MCTSGSNSNEVYSYCTLTSGHACVFRQPAECLPHLSQSFDQLSAWQLDVNLICQISVRHVWSWTFSFNCRHQREDAIWTLTALHAHLFGGTCLEGVSGRGAGVIQVDYPVSEPLGPGRCPDFGYFRNGEGVPLALFTFTHAGVCCPLWHGSTMSV